MSTWTGISHARMTRAMSALKGGEYKVLAAVRRLIPDGQRRKISQADLARRAGVSEGTVSAAMRRLEGAYIRRQWVGAGRGGGYEIEVLPPPEQRAGEGLGTPAKGSNSEESQRSLPHGSGTPETASHNATNIDPSLILDHAHEQQQQPGPEPDSAPSGQTRQLAPETIQALADAGAHPKLIQRVAEHNPTCTPADVARALAAAGAKPSSHTPPGLALSCLALAQQVVAPRPVAAPAGEKPTRGRAVPQAAAFDAEEARRHLAARGVAVSPPEPPRPAPARLARPPLPPPAWHFALDAMRALVSRQEFEDWLRPLVPVALDGDVATVAAPSAMHAERARGYDQALRRALGAALGRPVQIQIVGG